MVVLKSKDKEFKLIPRTRKVVELTEKLKGKNLSDLIFKGINDGDIKVLVELIKAFAENEEGKQVFYATDNVYDFIDGWVEENGKSYTELYKEVMKVANEMGFTKTKMTEEELENEMNNPMSGIDINEIILNSTQKVMDNMAQEEFKGYQG